MLYLSGVVRPDMPAMIAMNQGGHVLQPGQRWAADNGRYSRPDKYTDAKYLAWLARHDAETCLFATAPDVVGDAATTIALSAPMFGPIRALGYSVALVAQDGLEHLSVPWDDFDALFIGGTTSWKLGDGARSLATEAKARGKWVHMGRVNSLRRMRYAESIGCDSADGTWLKHRPPGDHETIHGWVEHVLANPSLWRPGR